MSTAKDLYSLRLHESMEIYSGLHVLRVPGGWIYTHEHYEKSITETFVPFNNEFQKREPRINPFDPPFDV